MESNNTKEIVNQVAMQEAMAAMMALRDMDAGPWLTTAASQIEPQRQRHSGPVHIKLTLSLGAQDRYSEHEF